MQQALIAGFAICMCLPIVACESEDKSERKPDTASAPTQMRLVSEGRLENSVRYNPITGATQRLVWEDSRTSPAWKNIPEMSAVPQGDFEVRIVQARKGTFVAVRMDRITGKTWLNVEGAWEPVREGTSF
jgi:hypothetical protein